MSVKPSTLFKVGSFIERKLPQSSNPVAVIGAAKNLVWAIYSQATGTYTEYTAQLFRRTAKAVSGSATITTPAGASFILVETRVRITQPATASAVGKFTINGSDVTGATAIALDSAAGTIITSIPTAANTGSSGQAIAFAVSGDTNGTFRGEVEVVYRPTGQFSTFV